MSESTPSNWQKTLLQHNATVADAISCLNDSMLQIVLVVDEQSSLIGTITDGDIRRSMLKGIKISDTVENIINSNPLVISTSMKRDSVLQLMQVNKIHQLPVVDQDRKVVGLHLWNKLMATEVRHNTMIIMAGGKGTRLRPYTENCPKPMIHVAGKPMLERIIERAKQDGFGHFILSIHYLGHMIEDYFEDGSKWGVKIEYLREDSPLGTAGALSLLSNLPTLPVLITNGDVLTDIRYSEIIDFHHRHYARATMAVRQHQWEHPFGVVKTDGVDIIGFEEKPISYSHINAGIYVLEPSVFSSLNENEYCDMPTLFARLKDNNHRTIVYPMHEPWLDVGRHDDLELANKTLSK